LTANGRILCFPAGFFAGDLNVPAGEITWRAQAAPLQQPWAAEEQRLLQLRPQLVAAAAATAYRLAEAEAADAAAGGWQQLFAVAVHVCFATIVLQVPHINGWMQQPRAAEEQ
jgi:hypothetical protein